MLPYFTFSLRQSTRALNTFTSMKEIRLLNFQRTKENKALFFSRKATRGLKQSHGVSRTKHRKRDRRENARSLKTQNEQLDNATMTTRTSRLKSFLDRLIPKVPGQDSKVNRRHLISLGYRLPLILALLVGLTNDDIIPYSIQGSIGPSMLPTIQVFGDIWLVETWAFHHLLGKTPHVQVGDIVLWKHPDTGRVSCKRVIGLEGSIINRFGQYSYLYRNRKDLGVVSATNSQETLELDAASFSITGETSPDTLSRTQEVPGDHVWLEGDCPLLSLDSRQYGPIPVSWLSGRLIYRLWPFERQDGNGKLIPCRVSRDRPVPYPVIDDYLGKKSNLHRIAKK